MIVPSIPLITLLSYIVKMLCIVFLPASNLLYRIAIIVRSRHEKKLL